jgi:hypothetical protein
MKFKTIVILSFLGCLWGGFAGHEWVNDNEYKLAAYPLLSIFNPEFIERAEGEGFELVFDRSENRIGVVVSEELRWEILSLREELLAERKEYGFLEPRFVPRSGGSVFDFLDSVPAVGEVIFNWTATKLREYPQVILRKTTVLLGVFCGCVFGFLCHFSILVLIWATTRGIQRSCNTVQKYLFALFPPLILLGIPLLAWVEDEESGIILLVLWLVLVFLFELMLFSSTEEVAKLKKKSTVSPRKIKKMSKQMAQDTQFIRRQRKNRKKTKHTGKGGSFEKLCSGGSGSSVEDAVVVTAPSSMIGVFVEHSFIQNQCGERGEDWNIAKQSLLEAPSGKYYDLLEVRLKDGTIRGFYFDISAYYSS